MRITDILARNNRLYRDKTALVERIPAQSARKALTWHQFYVMSCRLANALNRHGVQKSDTVVQLMTNSLEWLPIYFGILYAGAWAVPLNFRFESDKILLCAQASEPKVFIFGPEFIARLDTIRQEMTGCVSIWIFTGLEKDCPDWAVPLDTFIAGQNGDHPPEIDAGPDDSAALYFTSGTTGTPKAVLITHKNLTHACEVENKHHGQTHEDIFLCIPPLYHTGAKMHWMGSFLMGGKCILLNGVKPEWILEAVSEEQCTIAWLLVPWAHDILISIENSTIDLSKYHLDQWRLMHSGAQPVPPSLVNRWKKNLPVPSL